MRQVRDGPGHAQHAIMSARGEVQAPDGHFERSFAALVQLAKRAELRRRDLRIIKPALALCFTRLLYSFTYLHGGMAIALAA